MKLDEVKFMNKALKEARKAYEKKEVPVGAIIVLNGKVIAKGHNMKETKKCATQHAEIIAINKASKKVGWRLENASMYVTLEPCPMCAGAIIQSRIKNLYFATKDPKTGAAGSVLDLFSYPFNHQVNVINGVCEEEATLLLKSFFKLVRLDNKDTL